eukprot:3405776-Pyramimonas_sp.AAC.1
MVYAWHVALSCGRSIARLMSKSIIPPGAGEVASFDQLAEACSGGFGSLGEALPAGHGSVMRSQ